MSFNPVIEPTGNDVGGSMGICEPAGDFEHIQSLQNTQQLTETIKKSTALVLGKMIPCGNTRLATTTTCHC